MHRVAPATGSIGFSQGKGGIESLYPGGFTPFINQNLPFEWDVTLPPGGPAGQYALWKGNVMAISATTKHVDAAWTFLKFLLGPRSQGHEIYVRNRRFPPLTADQRLWNLVEAAGKPKSMKNVTLTIAASHGRLVPKLLNYNDIMAQIRNLMSRLSSGQASPQMAIDEVADIIRPLMNK